MYNYELEAYFSWLQIILKNLGSEVYYESNQLDLICFMGRQGWRVVGDTNLFEIEFEELVRHNGGRFQIKL